MKTNHEQNINFLVGKIPERRSQKGNALIYVLIAIALFAALGFTMMRQTDSSEMSALDDDRAELLATQLISYSAQAKSAADQMLFQGARIDNLDFILPGEGGYDTPPNINKVYHPDGGGLINSSLAEDSINQIAATPLAGWYMGRFNNIEWTRSTDSDVILTAHNIRPELCRILNEKITGSTDIPALTGDIEDYLIDTTTNTDLTMAVCPGCGDNFSLCVSNSGVTTYSFYTIIADQ
jgi:hypothetical protein